MTATTRHTRATQPIEPATTERLVALCKSAQPDDELANLAREVLFARKYVGNFAKLAAHQAELGAMVAKIGEACEHSAADLKCLQAHVDMDVQRITGGNMPVGMIPGEDAWPLRNLAPIPGGDDEDDDDYEDYDEEHELDEDDLLDDDDDDDDDSDDWLDDDDLDELEDEDDDEEHNALVSGR